ncbi:MAG: IS5 family transposase [archaeon]|nr:IS5 family transposase [archaeon]
MITKKLGKELLKFIDKVENLVLIQPTEKIETEDKKYSQVWSAYNEAQTSEKMMFINILQELLSLLEVSYRKRKGHPNNDLHEMIFCCALKVYGGHSSRRTISELALLQKHGYIEKVPHFNTLLHYFDDASITPILKKLIEYSAMPLKQFEEDFAVDASGFSTSIFARWFDHKWGEQKDRRVWIKCHLISGVKTNIITGVEITPSNLHDTSQFQPLVRQTNKNFEIREISADKAYMSRKNLEFVSGIGAIPYIPFKSNTSAKGMKGQIWRKMFEIFILKREEFLKHYHKRSNAESVFHMVKAKFGNSLKSKNGRGMANEILFKVLCHNICVLIQEIHELGIEVNYCAENYPAQQVTI